MNAALASSSEAEALFQLLLDMQALWPLRVEPTGAYPADETGQAAFAAALPEFLRTQEYLKALEDYRSLIQTSRRVVVLTEKELVSPEQIYDDREVLESLRMETASLDSGWRDRQETYREGAGLGLTLNNQVSQAEEVLKDIGATLEAIKALDSRLLYRLTLLQGAEFERLFRVYEGEFDQAVELQDGKEVTTETETRLEKYPARARDIYLSLQGNLEDLAGELVHC